MPIPNIQPLAREAAAIQKANLMFNRPKKVVYIRFLKEKKPKDFQLTADEETRLFQAVVQQNRMFHVFNQQLAGLQTHTLHDVKGAEAKLFATFDELLLATHELQEIYDAEQDDLQASGGNFIALFEKEREIYKGLKATAKKANNLKAVERGFKVAARQGDRRHASSAVAAAAVAALVTFMLAPNANAGSEDAVQKGADAVVPVLSGIIDIAVKCIDAVGVATGFVVEKVGQGVEWTGDVAQDSPTITGLVTLAAIIYGIRRYRNR